jgi:hypothetical protein
MVAAPDPGYQKEEKAAASGTGNGRGTDPG